MKIGSASILLILEIISKIQQNTGCSKVVDPILNTHISETT